MLSLPSASRPLLSSSDVLGVCFTPSVMRARGYVGKVRVKVKPRGSLSAVKREELRSEVMESLGDEGRGQLRGADAGGE